MDLGPLGFMEPDRALLAAAVSVIKSFGVDHSELEGLLSKSLRLSEDVQKCSSESSGLRFEAKSESLEELEFFYSGSRPVASHLKKLLKNENDKQIRAKIKEYISNYLEEKITKSLGNPRKFLDLRNPLKRIGPPAQVSQVFEPYFDCWSRLHTIHSHTQIEPTQDLACLVYHLIFDQTSNYILSASGDGLIKIYDKGLHLLKTVRAHKRDISILTLSSDNKYMVSADEGGLIRIWEFPSARPVAVLTDQVGHEITTLHYQFETKLSADGKEIPWKAFLMTTSPTAGFYIYEERNFINNMGIKQQNQEFINLSARIRDENGVLGFIASETNPRTGIIAAYSVKGNIYIWPRLSDMFANDLRTWPVPLKIIQGFHLSVEAALNATQQQIILQWSPNGMYLFSSNESMARVLSYDPTDHSFTQRAELVSDLQPPPYRRRGLNKSSFGSLNDSFVVVCFNLTSNSSSEQFTQTCMLIYDLSTQSLLHKVNQGKTAVNMSTNTLAVSQHPIMEHICATTNTHGQIILWDCSKGVAVRMFVEHAGHVGIPLEQNTVSDCNFSKCGNYLAVGTSYGSFSLYGYGGSDLFEHVEMEQFTSMDFTPVDIFEETQEVICRGTGLTINSAEELAQTYFCNLNLQPQSRLSSEVDYRTARVWLDEKTNALRPRVLEMKKHDDNRNAEIVPVVAAERKRGIEYRKKYKEALLQAADGDLWALQPNVPVNAISTIESIPVQTVQPPSAVIAAEPVQRQPIEHFQPNARDENSDEEFVSRRRLRRGRLVSESSVHEDEFGQEEEDIDEDGYDESESEVIDSGPAIRTRRRALLNQQRHSRYGNRRRSERLRGQMHNTRSANNRPLTMNLRSNRTQQEEAALGKREMLNQSQNSDEDSAEFYRNFGKNRQSNNAKKESLAAVEEEHFCTRCQKIGARERCEGSGDDETHGCHRIYHRDCSDLCGADIKNNTSFHCFYCLLKYYSANHRDIYEYNKRNDLENSWLEMLDHDVDFMAPQLNDTFYFIWQPYESFVSRFFDILNFKLGKVFWPWDVHPELQLQDTKVVVENIKYEYPEIRGKKKFFEFQTYLTTIMSITLRIVSNEESMEEDNKTFEIKYFPASDAPSFLIWHTLYERKTKEYQIARNFGDVKYGNDHYSIRDKSPFEDSFEGTLYRALKIRAVAPGISTRHREQSSPDGELSVSPWDVEFSQNTQIVANTKPTLRKVNEESEVEEECASSGLLPETKARFEEFMQGPAKHAGPFLFEVDLDMYPNYLDFVRVHMYLMKIYLRVKGDYYRSVESLRHDLEIMKANAESYNAPNSKITEMAKLVLELVNLYLEGSVDEGRIRVLVKQISGMNMSHPNFSIGAPPPSAYNLRRKRRESEAESSSHMRERRMSEESESSEAPATRRARRGPVLAAAAEPKRQISLADRKTRHEQRLMRTSGGGVEGRGESWGGEKENPEDGQGSRIRTRNRFLGHKPKPMPPEPAQPVVAGTGMALRRRSQH